MKSRKLKLASVSLSLCLGMLAISFLLLAGCASPHRDRSVQPEAPRRISQAVSSQISDCFGPADLRGVPVVDTTMDWRNFENWPERFSFNGIEYHLRLSARSLTTIRSVLSLDDLASGEQWLAQYEAASESDEGLVLPMGAWYENGAVKELGAGYRGNNVFILQYYPTGQFFMINYTEPRSKRHHVECYDRSGRLRGNLVGLGPEVQFKWDNRRIRRSDFNRKIAELYRREAQRLF